MKARGFTLMEMVMTIVIGSIITLGITSFVRLGMTGYADSVKRQRLQSQAQFVIEKMSREIRHAVPNSFSIADGCLEFMPISYSGFYSFSGDEIKFVVGAWETQSDINDGLRLVINPTRLSDLSSTANSISLDGSTVEGDVYTIAKGELSSSSVSNRHYIYDPSKLIKYCFVGSELQRNDVTVAGDLVYSADQTQSYFKYSDASLHRGGLVHLKLEFSQSDERSVYQHDVQVLNVP